MQVVGIWNCELRCGAVRYFQVLQAVTLNWPGSSQDKMLRLAMRGSLKNSERRFEKLPTFKTHSLRTKTENAIIMRQFEVVLVT